MTSVIKILILILLVNINLFAQEYLLSKLKFADSLFSAEKYFDAITEYKRLLFFDSTNQFSFDANFRIGLCYKEGAKFDEALKYFVFAEVNSRNPQQIFESKIYQVRINILRRSVLRAEKILNELENDLRFIDYQEEVTYWRAWNKIFSDDWEAAAQLFSEINETYLANLCLNTYENLYSVDFAKYSSMVLPGLGQFYTGEYLNGILSLSWNILSAYLTISAFNAERVLDGIVTANLLWFRFYRGNFQNAEKFANAKNISITNQSLLFLQNDFIGLKP
uniref:Tetratricopeptide repeat protein n=1 Tax=Ignavibacterium album TaxID=591197 RepID=A0A7V3E6U5_9BACT